MRLKCIKLVGFKSFVDATTVQFPSHMCGVVGPNGCGKSNIIDAVRWVMGESSAKNLRGESMTDVIFKGSKARKPSGYAQVELIFDNNQGRITGEYAAYAEISIKRRLSSDSQNTYFLNGTKCRRRDIMDIFLGTGLGPRSYSIISQGMVSNLIESRPEELRVFIEEAAGISRYKERRRETENRIRRTGENMERLTDLREELDRRLSHLKRQAEAAEKYKNYREQERYKRAQLHGLRWRDLNKSLQSHESSVREHEIELEAAVAKQVAADSQMEKLRLERQESDDKYQSVQAGYYRQSNEITRLEQKMTHRREKQDKLSQDLQDSEALWTENQTQIQTDRQGVTAIEQDLNILLPEVELILAKEEEAQESLLQAEEARRLWQQKWDTFNERAGTARRNAEVSQSGIQHVDQVISRLSEQVRRDEDELARFCDSDENEQLSLLQASLLEQEEACKTHGEQADILGEKVYGHREKIEELVQLREAAQQSLSEAKGKEASVLALQSAALNQGDDHVQWLQANGLSNVKRLAESIRVKSGWETAVETVLGDFLQAVPVDSLHDMAATLTSDQKVSLCFFENIQESTASSDRDRQPLPLLASCIDGEISSTMLHGVMAAETLEEALQIRPTLGAGESVITLEGIWLGSDWLRVSREQDVAAGILTRQTQLEALAQEIADLTSEVSVLHAQLTEEQAALKVCETEQHDVSQMLSDNSQRLGELRAECNACKVQIEQQNARRQQLEENLSFLKNQQMEEEEKLSEHRIVLQESLDTMENDSHEHGQLKEEQEAVNKSMEESNQALYSVRDDSHALALKKQALEARHQACLQAIERLITQQQRLDEQLTNLRNSASETSTEAEESLQAELEGLLEKQLVAESEMKAARSSLDKIDEQLVTLERQRSLVENEVQKVRLQLEQARMHGQEMQIRCTTLNDQLLDEHFDLSVIVENLPEEASEDAWEQALAKLESRIAQLGAINLAAIEEYDQQSERLNYLNQQNADLENALSMLNQAIERIDKETRHRFEITFDQVNKGLQELFPKVFGGGNAYLKQTGDDLLDTGVTIMAQPPGKKNSTIHLLSGGEKALTAIALVFSIFRLNPSPFCLLDEVDAPLDDANVGRYIKMVQEMSLQVQFIYVTHNKIAMEEARQLIGVTMHEPGVSRPVSVDIDAAAVLASA